MKLILSDRALRLPVDCENDNIKLIDLSLMKIANCTGCFGCWTKTPGKCVIRDDAVKIYPLIAASDVLLYVSRVKYGGYDTVMKTMLERAIPIQKAFIHLLNGETHHVQRSVAFKRASIIAYGNISNEEKELFKKLVARNVYNMNFKSYKVIFTGEEMLEETVKNEVLEWEK